MREVNRVRQSYGRPWTLLGLLLCVAFVTFGCVPQQEPKTGPEEVNYWEQRKGNCDTVLNAPHTFDNAEVTRCMKMWEMYRSVGDLSVDMRSMYAVAFSLAWYNASSSYDKLIAEAALARICIPRHPLGPDGKIKEEVPTNLQCGAAQIASGPTTGAGVDTAPDTTESAQANTLTSLRGSVRVEEPGKRAKKKAAGLNKKGFRMAKKKAFGKAADYYEQALDLYPHYVTAQYNLVCAYNQMGDEGMAMEELKKLYSWDDPEVNAKLNKARTDDDLVTLRDNPEFKQMTGYFRLTIANAAGEAGIPHVTRIKEEVQARRYPVHQVVENRTPRLVPEIWFRPGFEPFAEELKTILGVKKVNVRPIDWDTLDDLIVIWGSPEAAELFDAQMAPVVQGTRAEEKNDGLGEITGAIKDTQGQMGDAVETGEGVGDSVPSN